MKTTTLRQLKCYVNLDTFTDAALNNWKRAMPTYGQSFRIQYEVKELIKVTRKAEWTLEKDNNNPTPDNARFVTIGSTNAGTITTSPPNSRQVRGVENTLLFPDIGGNKYTVKCVKRKTVGWPAQIVREFETWRRLWYTIYYTHDSQRAAINGLQTALQRAYRGVRIDLQAATLPQKIDNAPNLVVVSNRRHPTAPTPTAIGRPLPPTPRMAYAKQFFGGSWPDMAMDPFHFSIVLIRKLAKIDAATSTIVVDKNRRGTWQEQTANSMYLATDGSALLSKHGGYWRLLFKLPGDCVRTLSANARGQLQRGLGRRTVMRANDLVQSFSVDGTQIQKTGFSIQRPLVYAIDFSNPALRAYSQDIDAGDGFRLSAEMLVLDYSLAGAAVGNLLFVETHDYDVPDATITECLAHNADNPVIHRKDAGDLGKIVVHEVGHVLGMVAAGQTGRYQLRGPHCNHNTNDDHPDYTPTGTGVNLCVMYHQLHDQMRPQFCANCRASLAKVRLRAAALSAKPGWTNRAKDRL